MTEFLGLANQNCSTTPAAAGASTVYVTALNPGVTSWVCPATRYYTLTGRGAGGWDSSGGGSGGACQVTRLLRTGEVVTLSIGRGAGVIGVNGASTVMTLPSGEVVTAGGGTGPTAGTATGGDINTPGATTLGSGAGGIAPAIGNFPAVASTTPGASTTSGAGAGGGSNGGGAPSYAAGCGIVIIQSGKVPRIL